MSMNCPKCGFYQPEDQYCASCGVDMNKYQPKAKPLWQKILGNWIFQLALLLVVVLFLILKDNMSSGPAIAKKTPPRPALQANKLESSAQKSRSNTVLPPPVEKGKEKVLPPPMNGAPAAKAPVSAVIADTAKPKATKETLATTKAQAPKPMSRKLGSFFYLVPRGTYEALISRGKSIEDGVTVIQGREFGKEIKARRQDWSKLVSQKHSFEFDKSKLIFMGAQAGETTEKVGIYIRSNLAKPTDSGSLALELQTWSELKVGGESIEGPTTQLELARREILIISNIVPRDLSFSETDRSHFEGHPALKALNDTQFIEENSELVLVLQYK